MDFILILIPLKNGKKGDNFPQELHADMAWGPRGYDMARKATWQHHTEQRERPHGADVAQTRGRATRLHSDAKVAPTW